MEAHSITLMNKTEDDELGTGDLTEEEMRDITGMRLRCALLIPDRNLGSTAHLRTGCSPVDSCAFVLRTVA